MTSDFSQSDVDDSVLNELAMFDPPSDMDAAVADIYSCVIMLTSDFGYDLFTNGERTLQRDAHGEFHRTGPVHFPRAAHLLTVTRALRWIIDDSSSAMDQSNRDKLRALIEEAEADVATEWAEHAAGIA